jgi:hypothetical protein
MRTPLRARAFVEDGDAVAREPADFGPSCVHLLSATGIDRRGEVWTP